MRPPPSLIHLQHWVAYRAVPGKGKTNKVPISPLTGGNASSTDPSTWGSYQAAVDRAKIDNLAGVGFVFTNSGYTGVDLDHCVGPDGDIEDWAKDIIQRLNSYTEISPSGTGIHIIVKATLPPGRRRKGRIEMYDTGRFFTITGNHVPGTPDDVCERQMEIEALHAELFPPEPKQQTAANTLSDAEVITILAQSENAAEISNLMAGIWTGYPSQSEADLALCSHLAFATGGNVDQIDRLFRSSGLYRDKWDRGKPTYGERTIQRAIQTVYNTYSGPAGNGNQGSAGNGNQGPAANTTRRRRRLKSTDLIAYLAAAGYTFRLNDCDDSIECNGVRLDDILAAEIRTRLRDDGYQRYIVAAEDAYKAEAGRNRYHPVREYLSALQWDGRPHIETLAGYFTNKQGVFSLYLRKWLIGAVARVFTGAHHAVFVIDGPQDIGKSTFARWLCPLEGYYRASEIQPDNKDHVLALLHTWVWEVRELGSTTRRADVEALKGFLSLESVMERKPYGHYEIVKAPIASFIGTANNSVGLLSDPTGSRRFNVCTVERIDWNYKTDIDIHQVWAEAYAAYLAGESARLSPDEIKLHNEINEEYQMPDTIEDFLRKISIITYAPTDWVATADILTALQDAGLHGPTRSHAMSLAATMQKLGLKRKRWNGQWGYIGIKLT